ncbi:putative swi-snf complex subunit protein [Botrytis fragariae]|uniref:Putative swi-snf complex subunit protein n=1 Tax=Botrytis fragariae TaxID=1964551 RepID=A0A8H6AZF0_9HELO|nr:putative swi-snf complex subunit protein [Botrytis fragariae]KAF5876265.1 putative swi-snf complex subunit protein [Botrytis fragariae]
MVSPLDTDSPLYKRVSRCIASMIRFHRANASKEGLCPQVIISCYRLRHRWSPKALSSAQLQKEELVKRILNQMIETNILVKIPPKDTPSGRNLPATIEQSYVLIPDYETESCRPRESCDDLLSSGISRANQVVFGMSVTTPNSIISREFVSMSEVEPDATRLFFPTNTSILKSSTAIQSNKRRRTSNNNGSSHGMERSNSGEENRASSQSLTAVPSFVSHRVKSGSQSPETIVSNKTQSDAENIAQEVANLPWLTRGLQELREKYPDDQYELVYENDLLQIRCHDCKGRLYKVHYQNCDVSNMEWHAKSTVHANRVEERLAEAGVETRLTDGVKYRREALEAAKRTAPQRFRKPQPRPVVSRPSVTQMHSAPQHPGSTWNVPLNQEISQQPRTNSPYQPSSTPDQIRLTNHQIFELDSPSATSPTHRLIFQESNQHESPYPRIKQLESRVKGLELENNAHERTISVLQDKLRTQQQVNNTHQSVIKDLILRIQALEQKR